MIMNTETTIKVTYDNVAEHLTPGEIVTIHDGRGRPATGRLFLEHSKTGDSEYHIGVPGIGWRLSKPGTYMAGEFSLRVEVHGRGEIPVGAILRASKLTEPNGEVLEVSDTAYLMADGGRVPNRGTSWVPFDEVHGELVEAAPLGDAYAGRDVRRAYALAEPHAAPIVDGKTLWASGWRLADNRTWPTEAKARAFLNAMLGNNSADRIAEFKIDTWRVAHIHTWGNGDAIGVYFDAEADDESG